jgi:NADH:ubiquinone oxidoreductase subunit 5 (subunit L)/multisubunit Na+/H+ antiporter MnhA subunit
VGIRVCGKKQQKALMNISPIITSMPSLVLFLLVVVIGILASRAGTWMALRRNKKGLKETENVLDSSVAAILGLLAFMLGFTFSLSASRFENRRELVVKQANAIETSYLRTSLIPDKQKLFIRNLYHQYIDILIKLDNTSDIQMEIARLEGIQTNLWGETASLVPVNMDGELRSLFTDSVNEVIQLQNERLTVGIFFKIPTILWISLLLIFFVSMFSMGYMTDSYKIQRNLNLLMLAISFSMVIVLIADMDSNNQHSIHVSQQPLVDLRTVLQKNIP